MRVRRATIVDEYVEDGRAAVFVGEMVCVLSELATTAWLEVADDWTSAEDVSDVLADVHGSPPTGEPLDATLVVLRALADRGLLEIEGEAAVAPAVEVVVGGGVGGAVGG